MSGTCPATRLKLVVFVAEHHPLARRQAPQALVPRGRRQPGAYPLGVFDPIDVLE